MEQGLLVRKTTDNPAAYDSLLRGVEHFNRQTSEANVQARQMFEKAVELDPTYAEAYACSVIPTGKSGGPSGVRTPRTWNGLWPWHKRLELWMTPCPLPTSY